MSVAGERETGETDRCPVPLMSLEVAFRPDCFSSWRRTSPFSSFLWIICSSVAWEGPRGSRQHRQGDSPSLAFQNGHCLLMSDAFQAFAVHG